MLHSTQSFWVYLNDIQQGMLAKYVNSCNEEEWSLFIDTCVFNNISPHTSRPTLLHLNFVWSCATLPID